MAETLWATSHITGDCPSPDDANDVTDSVWAGPTANNVVWTSRWAIDDPSGALTGTQEISVRVRKTNHPSDPSVQVNLYEDGTLVQSLIPTTAVTTTSGVFESGTFDATAITDPAAIEVEVVATTGGGNPGNRASLQLDGIRFVAEVAAAVTTTVTLGGALPALTGSFDVDASSDIELAGTLPALTGSFAIEEAVAATAVTLSGTLPLVTGTFDVASGSSVALAGQLPALTGSADITAASDIELAGTLPAISGSFAASAQADVQLAGLLPTLTGAFDIIAESSVGLAGALPALAGSFNVEVDGGFGILALPANPFARYRASELVLSDTDPVQTWPDEGTGGNDLVQNTGANQPTFRAATFLGHPAVEFDGAAHFMQTAVYGAAVAQPTTIVLMGEWISLNPVSFGWDAATSSNRQALILETDENYRLFAGSVINSGTGPDLDPVCLAVIYDGSDTNVVTNNVGLAPFGDPGGNALGSWSFPARFDGTATDNPGNIRAVEMLIYDHALDSTELTDLWDYFNDTYVSTGETVTLAGTLPALTGDFDVTASSDTTLAGQLPALTGSFDVEASADVALAGTLPSLTGSFEVEAESSVALAGALPALTGSFTIVEIPAATVVFDGVLPALIGSFTITSPTTVTLQGILPALTGSFEVDTGAPPPGRPIQPLADGRPIQPLAGGRPIQPTMG